MEIIDKFRLKVISGICLLERGLLSKVDEVTHLVQLRGDAGTHLRMYWLAFPQPFWAACPSTQAVPPKNFFPSCLIGIPHLAARVCTVLPLHGEECVLFFSTVAFRLWSAAIKCLLPAEQTQPCQPALLHPLPSPHGAWGQLLPGLSPLLRVSLRLVAPDWSQLSRPDLWSLCCPWGLSVITVSVTSAVGTGGLCVPTGGCKLWVSAESAQEVQSSSGSTARAVALSVWQQRPAVPVAPTQ